MQEASDDIKWVIGQISKLRYELETDKPIERLMSEADDIELWNNELQRQIALNGEIGPTWFSADWLYVECYMYRAIQDFFARTYVHIMLINISFLLNIDTIFYHSHTHIIIIIIAALTLWNYLSVELDILILL